MKNITKIIAITTLLIVASCGKDKTATNNNSTAVNVTVSTPSSLNETFLTASGKIEAVKNANISTRMMGYVTNIPVKVGQKVTKGQLLISINSADISAQKGQIEASIIEATVAFNNAEKDYNRYLNLYNENSVSQKEMDDMTANFEMAKARLQAAEQMKNQVNAQLSYTNIVAPFSGIITGKFINEGDMANPGMPLLSIEAPNEFQVIAMVPESEITKINTVGEVSVLVKSTNQQIKGKIAEVSTSTKNTGGQYLVKVLLNKTNANLLSGMFASVKFPLNNTEEQISELIIIPESALIKQGQLIGIYTIGNNNTAILRWLRIGKRFGNNVEVLSGLSNNEQFIISSESKLFNGAKVVIQ